MCKIATIEQTLLAAEGYQFFAREAEEFAEMSMLATAEAWNAMERNLFLTKQPEPAPPTRPNRPNPAIEA